ncbi:MAG: PAS domain-containing protein, partial [Xanthobacteraceae bacterium]
MKQASSRELFGYWAARRGARAAPERGEIEPSAIRRALGDVFILEFDRRSGHPFRLAGTRVCALFGR